MVNVFCMLFGRLLVVSVGVGCLYSCSGYYLLLCGVVFVFLYTLERYFGGSCFDNIICLTYPKKK